MTDAVPLVSVVIPCYNAARTLSATLNSVLGQTWPAIEVMAVDDCSTDGTLDLLREHEAAFGGRLHVIALAQNRGSAGARNAGIDQLIGSRIGRDSLHAANGLAAGSAPAPSANLPLAAPSRNCANGLRPPGRRRSRPAPASKTVTKPARRTPIASIWA